MEQTLFIGIGFVITVLLCVINVARLTFSKAVRQSSYKKYRIACYLLAGSCACLAIGNIVHIFERGFTYQQPEICPITSIIISVSQSILITASLVILFSNRELFVRKLVWNTIPLLVFPALYFIATRFQADHHTYSLIDFWHSTCTNIPALIRFCFSLFFFIQCGFLIYRIETEKKNHLKRVNSVLSESEEDVQLNWIPTVFYASMSQVLMVVVLEYFPCFATEAAFRIVNILFYLMFPIYYINYSNTYNRVKSMLHEYPEHNPSTKEEEEQGMDALLSGIAQRNKQLFEMLYNYLEQTNAHLNPEMKIEDLVAELRTNRTYLANAIKQNRQKTIGDFILTLRIEHAQELLETTNIRIDEVAFKSGFNSLRTFNRNFKDYTHLTPEEYRNQKS